MIKQGDVGALKSRLEQEQEFIRETENRRLAHNLEVTKIQAKSVAPLDTIRRVLTWPAEVVVYIVCLICITRLSMAKKPVPEQLYKVLDKF